jgi:transposase
MVGLFTMASGMQAHRTQRGSLKGVDFETFVREAVVPCLVAGDVVILDNASCHKSKATRQLVEEAGARLLFLPAYSPDVSPIELAWRKVKARLREEHACTGEALETAIETAMQAITSEDARRFYGHCGYQKEKLEAQPQ